MTYIAAKKLVYHGKGQVRAYLIDQEEPAKLREIRAAWFLNAASFKAICRRMARENKSPRSEALAHMIAISLKDIERALQPKKNIDPRERVPADLLDEFGDLFDPAKANLLPLYRPGIDHEIHLERQADGRLPPLPWGPLYGMSREELLVLKKTLEDLLDKGFIRASSSAAGAPVLFVRKPGGGIRFCVDYRALNQITKKDRYAPPLISKTLRRVAAAK